MSQTRSGFVIEIPLGLWTTIEIDFEITENGSGIKGVDARLCDGDDAYDVPAHLKGLVSEYLRTWLLEPAQYGGWTPVAWVSRAHWGQTTLARLESLYAEGTARWEEDLDD